MSNPNARRALLVLLSWLGFSSAIISPIGAQPYLSAVHSAVENRAHDSRATVVLWVAENDHSLRLILYSVSLLAALVAAYCVWRRPGTEAMLATCLATSLVSGAITTSIVTLVGIAAVL